MPTVVRIPASAHDRENRRRHGIKIGCCRICTCEFELSLKFVFVVHKKLFFCDLGFHLQFLTTKCGLLKVFELLLGENKWRQCRTMIYSFWTGSCCETLLIRFGMSAANEMGNLRNFVQVLRSSVFFLFRGSILHISLNGHRMPYHHPDSYDLLCVQRENLWTD